MQVDELGKAAMGGWCPRTLGLGLRKERDIKRKLHKCHDSHTAMFCAVICI
jgi:hypothetical protein